MIRLGITGGIGSGKSYVSRMLHDDFGLAVYNCDIHARILTLIDPEVHDQLAALIEGVYTSEGDVDKQRLADYLFASEGHAQAVNGIIHPAVRRDLREWYEEHASDAVVAMESAILYESGFDREVDCVLYVDAPVELRIQRTMQRDGLTRAQVEQRMARQRSEEARGRASIIITNDGQADLHAQLQEVLTQKIKERKLC